MTLHTGACHCGAVRFEFDAPPAPVFECNCSICHARGAIWLGCDATQFRLLEGEAALGVYRFGTRTAQHFFCLQCGVAPFSHPRLAPGQWVINLRCVAGIDLAALKIHRFDGQHWEQAAQAFVQARSMATP